MKFYFILFFITCLYAEDYPDFNGGRPGQAETITIVPIGYYQIETNFSPTNNDGSFMFRTGILSNIESRFLIDYPFATNSTFGGFQLDASQIDLVFPFSKGITSEFGIDWHIAISHFDDAQAFSFASFFGYGISDKLGTFLGFYGDSPMEKMSDKNLYMDCGLTYLLKDNIQLDLNGGTMVSDRGKDSFVDMGIVFRFPN